MAKKLKSLQIDFKHEDHAPVFHEVSNVVKGKDWLTFDEKDGDEVWHHSFHVGAIESVREWEHE